MWHNNKNHIGSPCCFVFDFLRNRKNRNPHRSPKSEKPRYFCPKNETPDAKKGKNRKPQWTTKPKNRIFSLQKPKNRSKTWPKPKNRKSQRPLEKGGLFQPSFPEKVEGGFTVWINYKTRTFSVFFYRSLFCYNYNVFFVWLLTLTVLTYLPF